MIHIILIVGHLISALFSRRRERAEYLKYLLLSSR